LGDQKSELTLQANKDAKDTSVKKACSIPFCEAELDRRGVLKMAFSKAVEGVRDLFARPNQTQPAKYPHHSRLVRQVHF